MQIKKTNKNTARFDLGVNIIMISNQTIANVLSMFFSVHYFVSSWYENQTKFEGLLFLIELINSGWKRV